MNGIILLVGVLLFAILIMLLLTKQTSLDNGKHTIV